MELYPFDDAYVARLRAGDPFTQKHFHDYFSRRLKSKLYNRGMRAGYEIEDSVQDVFLRAWRIILSADGIRDGRTLGSFMNSICNHVFSEWLRRKKPEPIKPEHEQLADQAEDAFAVLVRAEDRKKVMRVLERLPQRDQYLLKATYWEECDKDEISRVLSVDPNYLRVLLFRARARFLGEWEREEAEEKEEGRGKENGQDEGQGIGQENGQENDDV